MATNPSPLAFTSISKAGIQRQLIAPAKIMNGTNPLNVKALWDTGATGTCISTGVAKALGLVATGRRNIRTPSGNSQVNTYLITIVLPNEFVIRDVEVCDSAIGDQGIDMLIGMDIITRGDFAISNFQGKTVFTFRIPSVKCTDYVAASKLAQKIGTHGKGNRKKKR